MPAAPHPEDIKAMIRKQFGSIADFERSKKLPERSVKDVLRGKSRPEVARVIAQSVGVAVHKLFPDRFSPSGDTVSKRGHLSHRQNAGAK